jgi:hypothetical protein
LNFNQSIGPINGPFCVQLAEICFRLARLHPVCWRSNNNFPVRIYGQWANFQILLWPCPENWSTRKVGQRGKLVNGMVVNGENWSMRKSGQRGKVVNGKLVNGGKAQTF